MNKSLFSTVLWAFWLLSVYSRPHLSLDDTSPVLVRRSSADSNGTVNPFITSLVVDGVPYPVMIDTGSLSTWVIGFETSNKTDYQRNGTFSSQSFSGTRYRGNCQLNDFSSIISFGSVDASQVSTEYGSLGLGFGTSDSNGSPTFLNSLYTNGIISSEAYTLIVDEGSTTIQLGDMDSSIASSASYISTTGGNTNSWAINIEQVSIGDSVTELNSMSAIFETGSPYIMLPSANAQSLFSQLGYAYMDYNTQIWYVPCTTSSDLTLYVNGIDYAVPASQWIDTTQPSNTYCPSLIRPASVSSMVLGSPFFKSVYVHFDVSKEQVALVSAPSTKDIISTSTHSKEVILTTYYFYSTTTLPCSTTEMSSFTVTSPVSSEIQTTTSILVSSSETESLTSSDSSLSTSITSTPTASLYSLTSLVSSDTPTPPSLSCFQTSTFFSLISSEGPGGQIHTSSIDLTSLIPCETIVSSSVESTTISSNFHASISTSINSSSIPTYGTDYGYSTVTLSCSECHVRHSFTEESSVLPTEKPSNSSSHFTNELSSASSSETTASYASDVSSTSTMKSSTVSTDISGISSYTAYPTSSSQISTQTEIITTEIFYETVTLPCDNDISSYTTMTRPVTSTFQVLETSSSFTEYSSLFTQPSISKSTSYSVNSSKESSTFSSTTVSNSPAMSIPTTTLKAVSTSSASPSESSFFSLESSELSSSILSLTSSCDSSTSANLASTSSSSTISAQTSSSLSSSSSSSFFPSTTGTSYAMSSSSAQWTSLISGSSSEFISPSSVFSVSQSKELNTSTSSSSSLSSVSSSGSTTASWVSSTQLTVSLSLSSSISTALTGPSNTVIASSSSSTVPTDSSSWSSFITTEVTYISTLSCHECEGRTTTLVWTEITTVPCPSSFTSTMGPSEIATSQSIASSSLSNSLLSSKSTNDISRVTSSLAPSSISTSSSRLSTESSVNVYLSSSYQSVSYSQLESPTSHISSFTSSSSSSTSSSPVSTVAAECKGEYCVASTTSSTITQVPSNTTPLITSSTNIEAVQCTESSCHISITSMVSSSFSLSASSSNSTALENATMIFSGHGTRDSISGLVTLLPAILCFWFL